MNSPLRKSKDSITVTERGFSKLTVYQFRQIEDSENLADWRKNNLEADLRSNDLIAEKAKDKVYAQHLYAALCNNEFQKMDVVSILKDEVWSCSWRHAGAVVADIREEGDYTDWYCSGQPAGYLTVIGPPCKYVPEGHVTPEVEADLRELGWQVVTPSTRNI